MFFLCEDLKLLTTLGNWKQDILIYKYVYVKLFKGRSEVICNITLEIRSVGSVGLNKLLTS